MRENLFQAYKSDLRQIHRRNFLKLGVAAGAAAAFPYSGPALADSKELTYATFGGDTSKIYREIFAKPFTADTGINVHVDDASPLPGKIKAMVESGKVVWDVCEGDGCIAIQLGEAGLLEPIDYKVVDKTVLKPGAAYDYGVSTYGYSMVLVYDKKKFPDQPPTLKDFFDNVKYPGKRAVYRYQMGATEPFLLAAGLKVDEIYKLSGEEHAKLALKQIKTLGDDVVYWDSLASSQQMFLNDEVTMGFIISSRAHYVNEQSKGRFDWTWDNGVYGAAALVIPKGSPNVAATQQFIASILKPERQIEMLKQIYLSPTVTAVDAMIPPELQKLHPGFPANLAKQIVRDEAWYAKYMDVALNTWLDGISN